MADDAAASGAADTASPPAGGRLALGVAYAGSGYAGWQRQPDRDSVQQRLEEALAAFAAQPVRSVCAGRTDAGVHALNQVVHIDVPVLREPFSWVRGTNRYLPADIALQWCHPVDADFHARNSARGRRYRYLLLESPVRPALEHGRCGWVFRALDGDAMREAAVLLLGTHDFSAFRAAGCQAASPVKTLNALAIERRGAYWHFDFDASAFVYHMVRNIVGCLVMVGQGARQPGWIGELLAARDRSLAAPTFAADGLYFLGPYYDARHGLPEHVPGVDWLC